MSMQYNTYTYNNMYLYILDFTIYNYKIYKYYFLKQNVQTNTFFGTIIIHR